MEVVLAVESRTQGLCGWSGFGVLGSGWDSMSSFSCAQEPWSVTSDSRPKPRNLRFHVEEEGKGVDPEAGIGVEWWVGGEDFGSLGADFGTLTLARWQRQDPQPESQAWDLKRCRVSIAQRLNSYGFLKRLGLALDIV